MPEYYLDIETYSPNNITVEEDKIISIQFQKLKTETGEPLSDLTILKEWESSEQNILQQFIDIFQPNKSFWFIPIGTNMAFEFFSLHSRWKKILGIDIPIKTLMYNHPYIDLKYTLVMLNRGSFRGASLDKFSKKEVSGEHIAHWYENKEYKTIENYIQQETEAFIEIYMKIKENIDKII